MDTIPSQILEYLQQMPWLEAVAVISSLLFTLLAAREKKACWYFGFTSSLIYIHICYHARLYQDAIISIYYVVMAVYGWLLWTGRLEQKKQVVHIGAMPAPLLVLLLATGTILTIGSGYFFDHYTDAHFPYTDAFTTVFALLATWMQAKKYLENWLIFLVVDFTGMIMYFQKELFFTSLLYFIYTIICIFAFISWKKQSRISSALQ